eukprot:TRINITY_DN6779_c0_g1_i1.p1 TRINITY_DN6779_c0_g1~~TRINITY_DN6779_c0_g1_i1.p1  ORF type:complete len:214 (-),score=68.43 TRINITY_DN6779_c0_g1_i1:51-692(-)
MMKPTNTNYEPAGSYSPFEDESSSSPSSPPPPASSASSPSSSSSEGGARRHPVATFFHLFFKISALVTYLILARWGSFVIMFVVITLLVAFDFWTVKNVTGRLLVGLRWWNEVHEDGTNRWIFESVEDKSIINDTESKIFWISLFITPVIWGLMFLSAIFNILWLPVVAISLALSSANVYGYWKCSRDAKKRLQGAAQGYLISRLVNRATGAL